MKILGIRAGHDAAAALIVDGVIVADAAEERFTRIKNDASFPLNALNFCLEASGTSSEELDCVAFPNRILPEQFLVFFDVPQKIVPEQKKTGSLQIKEYIKKAIPYESNHNVPVLPFYQKPLKLSETCTLHLREHHLAHAASACYTSGLYDQKALVVTMDGRGDGTSVALWRFWKNKIENLQQWDGSSSIGWFYANATEAMGWRHGSEEWKIMGLAPYGTPQPGALKGYYPEFENGKLVTPHDYGKFGRWNDHGANHYHGRDSVLLANNLQKMGAENFAAEVQRVSEEQAMNIILPWLKKEDTRHLLCAGGFFLNVKFNQNLWYKGVLDTQWIYPNAGDAGIAAGVALHAYYDKNPKVQNKRLSNLYLGPEYTENYIKELLDERNLNYRYAEDPTIKAAEYLAKNLVVGWFQGRMESGPRALGNRSILMSPLKAENKDILNAKVKYREHFRPFCPSLLAEKATEYLVNPRDERFMVTSFQAKEDKQDLIPAVVHKDGTSRPQMVKRDDNPKYYDLIKEFGELTGVPVILNTSFNIKGEPIVCHPREAIRCFYDTGLDVLVLGNFILEKPGLEK